MVPQIYDQVFACIGGAPNTKFMRDHFANHLDEHGAIMVTTPSFSRIFTSPLLSPLLSSPPLVSKYVTGEPVLPTGGTTSHLCCWRRNSPFGREDLRASNGPRGVGGETYQIISQKEVNESARLYC